MVRNNWIGMAGMCLMMCAGTAVAQDSNAFSKPLTGARGSGTATAQPAAGETRIFMRSDDDGESYEVTISGDDISAKVNGKAVPAERIRRSKDKIEILGKDGNVVKAFSVAVDSSGAGKAQGGKAARRPGRALQPQPPQPPEAPQAIMLNQPKVMIGITMSQPSDALAEHLAIKPGEAVVVDMVYEGLPAEKAGLKAQDIIVEVDGVHPVTQQNFRETINKKEPGDKVTLKILRKGEEKKITVELQKFDNEKLGMQGMGGNMLKVGPEGQQWEQELKNMPGGDAWAEAMKKALKDGDGHAWVFGQGPEGRLQFSPFGADAKRLDEMQGQIDKKIAELDEKLAAINKQMEKLEKLLNKLGEKQDR